MSEVDYLVGVEEYELAFVEDVLDDDPVDSQTVYKETIAMSPRAVAAVAAMRSGSGGGGGSQPAFDATHGRYPLNPQTAIWQVAILNTPTLGTFTLLVSVNGDPAVETAPIAFDATDAEVAEALGDAAGMGTSQDGGPLPGTPVNVGFSDVADVAITVGANTMDDSGSPDLNQTQVGSLGDTGFDAGAAWFDTDANTGWVNKGDDVTPQWKPLGDVLDGQETPLTINDNFEADSVRTKAIADGGSGMYTDEINMTQLDTGTDNACGIIATEDDPNTVSEVGSYQPGSLCLRNDGAGAGELWLKTGVGATDWVQVALVP